MVRTKELTKDYLVKQRIRVNGTDIYRVNGHTGIENKLNWQKINGPAHKYSHNDKQYYAIAIWDSENKKEYLLPVHRVIYAWYKGIAHAGLVINHIDNDPSNNNIDNLEEITQADNIKYRGPGNGRNQWLFEGMMKPDEEAEIRDLFNKATELRDKNRIENDKLRDRLKIVDQKVKDIKAERKRVIREKRIELENSDYKIKEQKILYSRYKSDIITLYRDDLHKYELEADILRETIHDNVVKYEDAFKFARHLRDFYIIINKK